MSSVACRKQKEFEEEGNSRSMPVLVGALSGIKTDRFRNVFLKPGEAFTAEPVSETGGDYRVENLDCWFENWLLGRSGTDPFLLFTQTDNNAAWSSSIWIGPAGVDTPAVSPGK